MRRGALAGILGLALLGGIAWGRPHVAAPSFHVAAHREPPQVNRHGWVAKPLRIITFVQGGLGDREKLRQFPAAIAHSHWLKAFRTAYGIPGPTLVAGIDVIQLPTITPTTTKADFQSWIDARMRQINFVGRPGYQTIYILYIPCSGGHGIDAFGRVSHHPGLDPLPNDSIFTHDDALAISYFDPSQPFDFSGATKTATHELAESATDEDSTGWYRQVSNLDKPYQDGSSPWVEDEGSGHIEVADLAQGSRWREKYGGNGVTYDYVRIISNAAVTHGGDPAVPASPHPYYNTTAPKTWYDLPIAGSTSVKVTGWSTKKIPAWPVAAGIPSWSGSKDGSGQDPCKLGSSSFTVANGGTFTLKVTATAPAALDDWCVVRLKSSRFADAALGDVFHAWYIGFRITRHPASVHKAG